MSMSEQDLANGKTVFECMLKGVGEEAMRKLQALLNHGFTNDRLLGKIDWNSSPDPEAAKQMYFLCLDYMREELPIAPWVEGVSKVTEKRRRFK